MKERIIERIDFIETLERLEIMKNQLDTLFKQVDNQRAYINAKTYMYQYMICIASINNLRNIVSEHVDEYYKRNDEYDEIIMTKVIVELKDILARELKIMKMMVKEEKDLTAQLGLE